MKYCCHCHSEIHKKAWVCPYCKKSQRNKIAINLIAFFIILYLIFWNALFNVSNYSENSNSISYSSSSSTKRSAPVIKTPVEVDLETMFTDLDSNALNAKDSYKGKYIKLVGKVSIIDSNGAYFSISNPTNQWNFNTLQVFTSSKNKSMLKKISKDQLVSVTGTIIDVGEIIGYQMQLDSVKAIE